ncbi:MAG: hypothetical protein VKI83_08845 [Synechococcaceae cyanobacterium]|nr:hypothetical protein [Synechococcaceae cyanobacterium]
MRSLLSLLLIPIQAPMVLLLVAVSTYLGMHWSLPLPRDQDGLTFLADLVWSAECLQALIVVLICTVPMALLRRVSDLMAASRVVSLVTTLLTVIIGGLYLLHMEILSNVLILGSAVMLARLDLLRIRVSPPPLTVTLAFMVLVLGGLSLGRSLGI